MNQSKFAGMVLNARKPIPMPIGVYAGVQITGASVEDVVSNAHSQIESVLAIKERFNTEIILTAMDLSVEAELFGCQIRMLKDEIPTVIGRRVTGIEEIKSLPEPIPGDGRTSVPLNTARALSKQFSGVTPVLGSVIGPFSLAGRLFGVSEILELSLVEPGTLQLLLTKVTNFLCKYIAEFRKTDVDGVIMAEPAAGLLSPKGLSSFSSKYIRQIIKENQTDDFVIILHNCGARLAHLPYILESGAEILHFGAPMDLSRAIKLINPQMILSGNLDPTAIFQQCNVEEVISETKKLMLTMKGCKNFIPSSGCDIPPGIPLRNLDAFFSTVRETPVN